MLKTGMFSLFAAAFAFSIAGAGSANAQNAAAEKPNTSSTTDGNSPATPVTTGWHYVHATHCEYDPGGAVLYVYPSEGGYLGTYNTGLQNVLVTQCAQDNWIAYNVNNTNGTWDYLYTYSYK